MPNTNIWLGMKQKKLYRVKPCYDRDHSNPLKDPLFLNIRIIPKECFPMDKYASSLKIYTTKV